MLKTWQPIANQNYQAFLARLKTSSPELKLCENFRSVFQTSGSCAYGKGYILVSHGARKKPRNPRVPQQHFTTRKIFNIFSTNPSFKNSANKKRSKKRSLRRWAEAMHMMHTDSNAMRQDRKRLAKRSIHLIMSSANAIQRSSTHYEIWMTAYLCSSCSPIFLLHQLYRRRWLQNANAYVSSLNIISLFPIAYGNPSSQLRGSTSRPLYRDRIFCG